VKWTVVDGGEVDDVHDKGHTDGELLVVFMLRDRMKLVVSMFVVSMLGRRSCRWFSC
jgi:hypothetical protein